MKALLLFVLLFSISSICNSQNYKRVDSIISEYPTNFKTPERLSKKIDSDFITEFDKLRAIYSWIALNITYDLNESNSGEFTYSSKEELEKKRKKNKTKTTNRVVSKGIAVCHGYATLFQVLCENLGIQSKYITGFAKTYVREIGKRYISNHAWNIVRVDDKDYLLDTTWGAGTNKPENIEKIDFSYFLTDPKLLLQNHYPDDYRNALTKEKLSKMKFVDSPLIYNVTHELISPKNGIIKKAGNGKMVKFKLLTDKKVKRISYKIGNQMTYNIEYTDDKYLEFSVYLPFLTKGKELTIFFDYEAVLGYKLE